MTKMDMSEQEFKEELASRVEAAEHIVKQHLAKAADMQVPATITEAMNYSVLAGGKRLRPVLLLEMFRLFGGEGTGAEYFAAAIEMIHTYSLVHDDLPAMDNDMYRRGKKTTWAVYGDALGVLAGDALLNFAFETAAAAFAVCKTQEEYARTAQALQVLARNAGIDGMIGGQVADIEAEENAGQLGEDALLYIHTHKTGALIRAAMLCGAILAGVTDREQLAKIERAAMDIGVAFQIQDDILDVTGDSQELGKPVGSDAVNGKTTYVTLKGVEESAREVARLSDEAIRIVKGFPGEHRFMEALIAWLIDRRF